MQLWSLITRQEAAVNDVDVYNLQETFGSYEDPAKICGVESDGQATVLNSGRNNDPLLHWLNLKIVSEYRHHGCKNKHCDFT